MKIEHLTFLIKFYLNFLLGISHTLHYPKSCLHDGKTSGQLQLIQKLQQPLGKQIKMKLKFLTPIIHTFICRGMGVKIETIPQVECFLTTRSYILMSSFDALRTVAIIFLD